MAIIATRPAPYQGAEIAAAYKAIYGGLPTGMMDKKGNLDPNIDYIYPGAVLKTPTGEDINASQLMSMYQQAKGGSGPDGAGGAPSAAIGARGGTSYLSAPAFGGNYGGIGSSGGMTTMATGNSPNMQQGNSQVLFMGGNPLSAAQTAQVMQMYQAYEAGDQQAGQNLLKWGAGMGLKPGELNTAVSNLRQSTGPNAAPSSPNAPETNALTQMAQIDPASEALRTALGKSYTDQLAQAQAPTAQQYQSYLDLFKQVDPAEYAQRQGLATSMDSYLKQAQAENALGSQLDPVTARQVEQQTRLGQAARGNVYGTPQMVQEAMTTGQAGEARKQQRLQNLSGALGQQQGYLGAGLGLGSTAMNLYQQGLGNRSAAQQSALGYLGSGQTPYQAGASYLNAAEQRAAMAAQGGPQYNPAALGQGVGGTSQQAPQYGLDIGAQTQNWYNSLGAYAGGGGMPVKNKGAAAAGGAMTGAVSGAAAGAPLAGATYGLSIPIGAVVGGALGGAGGYYS